MMNNSVKKIIQENLQSAKDYIADWKSLALCRSIEDYEDFISHGSSTDMGESLNLEEIRNILNEQGLEFDFLNVILTAMIYPLHNINYHMDEGLFSAIGEECGDEFTPPSFFEYNLGPNASPQGNLFKSFINVISELKNNPSPTNAAVLFNHASDLNDLGKEFAESDFDDLIAGIFNLVDIETVEDDIAYVYEQLDIA